MEPDLTPCYPLDPHKPDGVPLRQGNYQYYFDDRKNLRQLDIQCDCVLQYPGEFHVATRESVLHHSELLENYSFPFHRKDFRNDLHEVRAAHFSLEGPMRVHVRILAYPQDRAVYVLLRNLEAQPVKRYRFFQKNLMKN